MMVKSFTSTNKKINKLLEQDSCLELSQLLTSTFNSTFSTYLQATMASYQLDNINACKTGSTDVDNLAVAYNPQVLVASWVRLR